ncbi:hypothetical protein FisN_29Lh100 [Fistulifera solaris]|uniref:Membrane transporter protein n=1 Tax=Fistulifera solaris TaxID=1519565 RepID=A0A1Z5JLU8_FISSO|nr:hypothetical protein FisN_29Lh100 [Fistulifera solaris]|eukprot:GAX14886.1 hypothetical protein FisN_29Lh100 [Fistulifera solaris]
MRRRIGPRGLTFSDRPRRHVTQSSRTTHEGNPAQNKASFSPKNDSITKKSSIKNHNSISDKKDIPKAFAIGTLAGTMGSLAGMGGGFVMIPLLTGVCRLSQHQAHGTSLAAVMATGLAGAVSYQDHVDFAAAGPLAAAAMLTASLGAKTTTFLSEKWLKRALGVLLLVMGPAVPAKQHIVEQYSHLHHPQNTMEGEENYATSTSHNIESSYPKWVAPASIGLCSGYLAGLFGVGGGTLVVPALLFTQQDDSSAPYTHHQALATSLAAMVLPAFVGTVTHTKAGNVAFRLAPPLALGALLGAYGGGKLAVATNESTLQWGFSALLVLLGVRTLQKTF